MKPQNQALAANLSNNRIPKDVKTIHITAVCGTGMGALAGMLQDAGFSVTGSDANVYPPMSLFLKDKGIRVMEGFQPENIGHNPDLAVIGNAVSADNPEVRAIMEKGIPFCSFPQAMNRFFVDGKSPVMVTGTHGKTTTSSLVAWLLAAVGLHPTFMIGGILNNFQSNHQVGTGAHVVLEGDEYDTAFFDKGPKFLHYLPQRCILTSVEFDHADIYRDLDHVKSAFKKLVGNLPKETLLIHYDNDENIREVVEGSACWRASYGKKENSAWRLGEVRIEPPWTFFEVLLRGEKLAEFKTRMVGEHNLLNALAAIAVAHDALVPLEGIATGLETFEGVKRRQEVRGVVNGVTVMDDFAHHPTAVYETVRAVKPFFPQGRVIAVFEPRTNSSMRSIFQEVYPRSFDHADISVIAKPPLLKKIPEGNRFDAQKLASDIQARGKEAQFIDTTGGIVDFVSQTAKPGDLVLVMSNGGFDNIHQKLLDALSA